jgi:hypothetical protein
VVFWHASLHLGRSTMGFSLSEQALQYFAHWLSLKSLCLALWMSISPAAARLPDAAEIAESIATAVLEQEEPVFRSAEEDAAMTAIWAYYETGGSLSPHPRPQSWDAKAGLSCGVWQQRCRTLSPSILGQAREELRLMRRGAVLCPAQPMAPLSGGCHAGRRLADRRVRKTRQLLESVAE